MSDNLENSTTEELERLQTMLNITKIQADIAESQAKTAKIYSDVEQDRERQEQAREINMANIERMRAETIKISKETRYFPATAFVGLLVAIVGLLGVIAGALLTK